MMRSGENLKIAEKIFASGMMKNLVTNLLAFINRTIFIYFLGKEFLGINSAVLSIINILSLSELGVGTSFIFILYGALNRNDKNEINSIMKYFKKIYNYIGVFIIVVGSMLIPFLDNLINTTKEVQNYVLPCYIILVLQTSISYLFAAYKRCLLIADKKENIVNKVLTIWTICNSISQIIIIILFRNYILYLLVGLISIIIQNLVMSRITQDNYYFLDVKNANDVSKNIKEKIKESVLSIMVVKIGQAFYKASDNILISKFLGVSTLAMCDNYFLLLNSIQQILSLVISSFTAIIGNLAVDRNNDDLYDKYNKLEFLAVILFMICAISYINCTEPFITAWLSKEYILNEYYVFFIATRFWVVGLNQTLMVFKDAMGLFKYGRFLSPITGIVNIILSIILLKYLGVAGVALASLICDVFIYFAVHPKAVIKIGMKKGLFNYYKKYIIYWIMYVLAYFISKKVIFEIKIGNEIEQFVINVVISVIVSIIVITIFMNKTLEFKYLINLIKIKCLRGGK